MAKDSSYRAYLLRCWQEGEAAPGKEPGWRFVMEEVLHPRRRWGFAGLAPLLGFLEIELRRAETASLDGALARDSLATGPYHHVKGETHMALVDCIQFATENGLGYLATTEGDQPRVRPMLLWRANEEGFYFCGLAPKNVWKQIEANPKVEVCFYNNASGPEGWRVLRVSGEAEFLDDLALKEQVLEDRPFYRDYGSGEPDDPTYPVIRIPHGEAWFWTAEYILREAEAERVRF
jgi:uncharacterized pyridoxamine 5'-phosphate oxidase family protein